jgi:two-component system sensor histidine kinase AlgZ
MNVVEANNFVFSSKYRLHRHILYWSCYLLVWTVWWTLVHHYSFPRNLLHMLLWLPVFMLYSYPLMYYIVPKFLLKERYVAFGLIMIGWGFIGWYINVFYRAQVFIPIQEALGFKIIHRTIPEPTSFLCMTTTAACVTVTSLMRHWLRKQREWLQAEQEKVTAQLQLLKAQLHPHFLFNTLNNIYSFALERSPKTSEMILELSTLLNYMLYECRDEEVLLEKEVEVMKNYIQLERERYGDKIDISINIEGDIQDKYIAPLLILPFLENAFKHGTSEQLDKPWMGIDICVKDHLLKCKVINSKNETVVYHENGIGVSNVRKRLEFLYPGKHDLRLADEVDFFVVSLMIELKRASESTVRISVPMQKLEEVHT